MSDASASPRMTSSRLHGAVADADLFYCGRIPRRSFPDGPPRIRRKSAGGQRWRFLPVPAIGGYNRRHAVIREMRATPERVKVWGVIVRTMELWPGSHTQHAWPGPRVRPANAVRPAKRVDGLAFVNGPAGGKASSSQIGPQLVDADIYVASESTTYRLQRAAHHFTHRGPVQPPVRRDVRSYPATGPVQACTRDMMYLKSPVRGLVLLVYETKDIWSFRIMDWPSFPMQRDVHRSSLFHACLRRRPGPCHRLVLCANTGGRMSSATIPATVERLVVVQSFSGPRVSDSSPQALFRPLRHGPASPTQPFEDLDAVRCWAVAFIPCCSHHR